MGRGLRALFWRDGVPWMTPGTAGDMFQAGNSERYC